jgi:hypothetical protein
MNRALWIVQGLLAALFIFGGVAKLSMPIQEIADGIGLPAWFILFIAVAEVAGALGLILPGMLKIRTGLTPLAAAGLAIIMIGATVLTANGVGGGDPTGAIVPFVTGLLAAFVVYGHTRRAPARRSVRQLPRRRVLRQVA